MKKAGIFFGFCLILMAFSYSVAGPKPTPEQLAALEAAQPPPDSTQDTLRFDSFGFNGIGGKSFVDSANYWIAVRFTVPSESSFFLQVVYFQVDNSLINTLQGCTVFVASDQCGQLGAVFDTAIVPTPLPNRLRSVALSDSIQFAQNQSFWVLLGPVPGGPDNNNIGNGWWALHDTAVAQSRSFISFNHRASWNSITEGNWVIRAGGIKTFSPAPENKVVINEVMFNADSNSPDSARNHEWVELFNPGPVQNTSEWKLTAGNISNFVNLQCINFPANKYLVIHLLPNSGIDFVDDNFSDGRGDMYLHKSGEFFNDVQDACGLLVDPLQIVIRDYIAWNMRPKYCGEPCLNDRTPLELAASANLGLNDPNKVVGMKPSGSVGPLLFVSAGTSIGRDSSGRKDDELTPPLYFGRDVTFMGGRNAAGPTMGRRNSLPLKFADSSHQTPQPADWTIMMYMAAEGKPGADSLSPARYYFDLLNQIEREIPTIEGKVNVVVLFDLPLSLVSSTLGERAFFDEEVGATREGGLVHDTTERVFLKPAPALVNTGVAAPLGAFIDSAKANFPAQHYVLALKGDGAGWEGLCGNSGSDRLEMGELKSALQDAGLVGTAKLDLLIMDAPLMGQLEVATQVKDFAHFMVASPEMIGPADFDYSRLVSKLRDESSTILAESLASFSVNSILAGRLASDTFAVWTAVNLDNLNTLLNPVDQLASNLRIGIDDPCTTGVAIDNFQLRIRDLVLVNSEHYGMQAQGMADFIDLKDFADKLSTLSTSGCAANYLGGASTINTRLAVGGPVILSKFAPNNGGHSSAGGLSIYFPSSRQNQKPITSAKKGGMFTDSSDHPFDLPGFKKEGNLLDSLRLYATDLTACYPHDSAQCDNLPNNDRALNHPFRASAGFVFAQNYLWDEFLIRYYKPVADAGSYPGQVDLNVSFILKATGTSDADSDPFALRYFWDLDALNDSKSSCLNDSLDDLDKNCQDDSTDEADWARYTDTTTIPGFSIPGARAIWLHVWDDHDQSLLFNQRQFQTDAASAIVDVKFRGVQLVYEDASAAVPYFVTLGSKLIAPKPVNLTQQVNRVNLKTDTLTKPAATDPHVIWVTGVISTTTFPESCRVALTKALANDDQGAWICGSKIANDVEAVDYFKDFGFEIANGLNSAVSIMPVAGNHFLTGLGTLPLNGSPTLQKLTNISCPTTFPLLMTNNNDTVAVARVFSAEHRALVYSTVGLEHLANQADKVNLLVRILSWLSSPQNPDSVPGCLCANIKGDLDSNGIYTSADVVLELNCTYLELGSCDICFADVTCDGILTSADVVALLNRFVLGSTAPPWCGP